MLWRYVTGIGKARLAVLRIGPWRMLTVEHDWGYLWLAEHVIGSPGFQRH
jgi:hypothetical protein